MPLPNDEKLIALSNDLIQQFDTIFGLNPGFRPAHAKGAMLTGTFTPSSEASSLTRAPHVEGVYAGYGAVLELDGVAAGSR